VASKPSALYCLAALEYYIKELIDLFKKLFTYAALPFRLFDKHVCIYCQYCNVQWFKTRSFESYACVYIAVNRTESSPESKTPIHHEVVPGDKAGSFRCKIHDGALHFIRLCEAFHWGNLDPLVMEFF